MVIVKLLECSATITKTITKIPHNKLLQKENKSRYLTNCNQLVALKLESHAQTASRQFTTDGRIVVQRKSGIKNQPCLKQCAHCHLHDEWRRSHFCVF